MNENYQNLTITELQNSEVEIAGEIPAERVSYARAQALKKLNESATIPGFRKGHVPESVLIRTVGEQAIMDETAELALAESYPHIVRDKKLDVIGRPEVQITKIAEGNPLGFKIKAALFPAFALPDYRTLAREALAARNPKSTEVSDTEVEGVLNQFRGKSADGKELPPLSDEDAKKFGNFNSLADLKARVKEDLQKQKERREQEEKRAAIAEKVVAASTIPLPAVLIESELEKMFAQFHGDIERMGMKPEDYFEKIKKTEEDVRKEWRPDAEKRAKLQLVLHAIATAEKITPPPEEVERETKHLLEHQKDADPIRARLYIEQLMTNEKVFAFLESQK